MSNGSSSLTSFSQIIQGSFKAIYRDQLTIESSKLETMCFLWWKIWSTVIFPKFGNLTILVIPKSQNWLKKDQIYIVYSNCDKNIKFNSYCFFEVSNSFLRPVFKIVMLWPIPNPSFWFIVKLGQNPVLLVIKGQNS